MRLIDHLKQLSRRLPKLASRNEWLVRLLDLPRCSGTGSQPGLIMIQIDGLSRPQFQRALSQRRLPFIRNLLYKRGYSEKPFYSGLPSSTPAVQGELFYGVKTAVPAFEFVERETGERHAMFYPSSANKVARKLENKGQALFEDGSAYSHVYSGGADTARYCAETMSLPALLTNVNPLKSALIVVFHITKLFRIIGYAAIELILAVYDFFKGVLLGENLIKELKFIPTRLFICVILRELIRMRVKMDIARGIPIVSANLLGYDEQAHRRGPASAFAHWTLKGIDEVVKDIYRTAVRSDCRDYRVVIYSDHGQEAVDSYAERFGKPVKEAVRGALCKNGRSGGEPVRLEHDNTLEYLYRGAGNLFFSKSPASSLSLEEAAGIRPDDIEITTMGPLGHIYLLNTDDVVAEKPLYHFSEADGRLPDLEKMARALHRQAGIPLVLFKKNGRVLATNDAGTFDLEEKKELFLGSDHPFPDQTAEDLTALCRHPNAGDLVISGYRPGKKPLSFSIENGAHGGPGKEETQGVVLLPPCMRDNSAFLRPLNLRGRILRYLGKTAPEEPKPVARPPANGSRDAKRLKVITYNIHSCIHMDGRINPDRTADVIAAMDPDIALLQEVDAHRRRTDFTHQGEYLAKRLGMACRFFPILENCGEQYGLAILSRFPFVTLQCIHFAHEPRRWSRESRGAILAEVNTPLGVVRAVNTHLGLRRDERRRQVNEILSNGWVRQALEEDTPLIIGGDFNDGPRSAVYKKIAAHASDIQAVTGQKGFPRATFLSRWPIMRLDHIFVSRHFRPGRVKVPKDYETRLVSDHLPLFCELEPAAEPVRPAQLRTEPCLK